MAETSIDLTDRCPVCHEPVAAVVVRTEPALVEMRSCNACDRRWWTADGQPADPVQLFSRR